MIELGVDRLLQEASLIKQLKEKKVGLVAHPASVTSRLIHSLDALIQLGEWEVTCAFGPQHGMRGEKQDNMIESQDYLDPRWKIPVFSLYGQYRRLNQNWLNHFDVLLIDLQDVGCRIYTFLTTLFYLLEDCNAAQKEVWILDRPNPAGRPIEGLILKPGWETFVGAGPLPMRHGLTLGEAAQWYALKKKLTLPLQIIKMNHYLPQSAPYFGWPKELTWVNPSPNMPRLTATRAYAGTVLIEGTHLSEGRGTTIPLEVIGAPDIDCEGIKKKMIEVKESWLSGCQLRTCYFEPTFHKHKEKLCSGIQIHCEGELYNHHNFKPFRVVALFLKSLRLLYPDYNLWKNPPYEYETIKRPFDILAGSDYLRKWVDDGDSQPEDLEQLLLKDEKEWFEETHPHYLY